MEENILSTREKRAAGNVGKCTGVYRLGPHVGWEPREVEGGLD
jgi:hypothetical protein